MHSGHKEVAQTDAPAGRNVRSWCTTRHMLPSLRLWEDLALIEINTVVNYVVDHVQEIHYPLLAHVLLLAGSYEVACVYLLIKEAFQSVSRTERNG